MLSLNPGAAIEDQPATTVFLPNIVKKLGGEWGWNTPFIVQNVGSRSARVTFDFYRFSDGALVKTRDVAALAPGRSVFHSPNHDSELAAGGQYAVVLRSFGAPIVAVVNAQQNEQIDRLLESMSYVGITTGSHRLYAPYVALLTGSWYCTVVVQNLGSGPSTVVAEFRSIGGGSSARLSRIIAPKRSAVIDPRFETAIAPGKEYALTLTSAELVGAVVNCHDDGPTVEMPRAFAYNALAEGATTSYVPFLERSGVTNTRAIVQNAGTGTASPKLRFHSVGAPYEVAEITGPPLEPGASWAFDPRFDSRLSRGEYALTVTGGQFATAEVTTGPAWASASTAAISGSTILFLPNVTRTLGGWLGWTTSINVQSTGALEAAAGFYRFGDGEPAYLLRLRFDATGSAVRIDPRLLPGLSDDTQFAVVIESGPGGVAATVSQRRGIGGDGTMTYEAVPQIGAP